MDNRIEDNDTATAEEFVDIATDEGLVETTLGTGVEFQACQVTVDLMDFDRDHLYDGVTTGVGAPTAIRG